MSKYGNRGVYLDPKNNTLLSAESLSPMGKKDRPDLIYFASLHEYEIFRILISCKGFEVSLQYRIELIPPNTSEIYPKGKYWAVDFMLQTSDRTLIPVEAKGKVMRDFPLILALLELHKPILYQNLWLVFPTKIPPIFKKKTFTRTRLSQRIVTVKNFQTELMKRVTQSNYY